MARASYREGAVAGRTIVISKYGMRLFGEGAAAADRAEQRATSPTFTAASSASTAASTAAASASREGLRPCAGFGLAALERAERCRAPGRRAAIVGRRVITRDRRRAPGRRAATTEAEERLGSGVRDAVPGQG
eukprot:scaffold4653_cov50-Phaeocystis_antarctica.AAC.3